MEPGEWIQERERMFQEYVWLFRELKEKMKETGVSDPFWEEVLEAVERFRGNYTCGYVQEMTMELLDALEKQEKEMKKEKAEDVPELPAKVQRLLDSCIEMQAKVRSDPELAKIYSHVNFQSIINDIEEYREQLRTAKMLFG